MELEQGEIVNVEAVPLKSIHSGPLCQDRENWDLLRL